MRLDRHGLFEQRDPPPGGAEQLRRRLDAAAKESRWPQPRVAVAISAAALVVLAAAGLLLDAERNADREEERVVALYEAPQFDRLLGRPLERTEPKVRLNDRPAEVAEIRTESDNVRLYRLE